MRKLKTLLIGALSVVAVVVFAGAAAANTLPRTGSPDASTMFLGLLACAVGAVSIRATKRRGDPRRLAR